jgi:fructokinase
MACSFTVACFGEILWDVLPTGKQPGGAPFNVAVHLHQLSQPVRLISRVGADAWGNELRAFAEAQGLDSGLLQTDAVYPTGVVHANVADAYEVTYEIGQPVAWDYLEASAAAEAAVAAAAAFVFGTLAARQAGTRDTLFRLLDCTQFGVFDVNLRPPHYTRAVVEQLLASAKLVKMNHHELAEIGQWLGIEADETRALPALATRFGLQAVCVTKGAAGALLWTGGQLYHSPGVAVTVQDTIGSGDAFLAALLVGWLAGRAPQKMLDFACAAGALVATRQGATPAWAEADARALMRST